MWENVGERCGLTKLTALKLTLGMEILSGREVQLAGRVRRVEDDMNPRKA